MAVSSAGVLSMLFAAVPILVLLFTIVSLILFLTQPKGSEERRTWKVIFIISACISGVFILIGVGLMILAGFAVANM